MTIPLCDYDLNDTRTVGDTLSASNVFCAQNTASQGVYPLKPLAKQLNKRKEKETIMQNRTIEIKFRLNRKETDALNKRVKKSGLSRESYLRQIINGLVPTDMPPPDYFTMMKELRHIGKNLNQIAQKAHILNVLDVKRYDENIAVLSQAVMEITNAVMLPRKMDMKQIGLLSKTGL